MTTIMDIKTATPHAIFWIVILVVILSFLKQCTTPDTPDSFKEFFVVEVSTTPPKYIIDSTGVNPDSIAIKHIAAIETYDENISTKFFLINGDSTILTIGIKKVRRILVEKCSCFIYSRGYNGNSSFIFSVQHIRACEIIEGYYRNLKLAGGKSYRVNKDTGADINTLIKLGVCTPLCREPCCRWNTD